MKIIFMGTPEFGINSLNKLNEKYDIVLVISQPNREKKKGVLIDTPIAKRAKELNLNLIQPENIKDEFEYLKSLDADILVTAAYGQYIPTKILNLFKKTINVHGSLLPKHRGGAPIQRAILEGDKTTGVTIMEMAKGLDTGKMYSKCECEILDSDNSTTLFEKLSIMGADLLMDSIEDIYNGKNEGVAQEESLATYSKNISKEEELLDLNKTSVEIFNQVRALAMTPGAYINVKGVNIKVFKVSIVDDDSNTKPGTVLNIKKKIVIKTKDKAISLDLLLYPGKKILTGMEFSNGQKIFNLGDII